MPDFMYVDDPYENARKLTDWIDIAVESLGRVKPEDLPREQLMSLAGKLFATRDMLDSIGVRLVRTSESRWGRESSRTTIEGGLRKSPGWLGA